MARAVHRFGLDARYGVRAADRNQAPLRPLAIRPRPPARRPASATRVQPLTARSTPTAKRPRSPSATARPAPPAARAPPRSMPARDTTTSSASTETATLTGLAPGTSTTSRSRRSHCSGTIYGSVLNFTTTQAPAATTSAATSVTATGRPSTARSTPRTHSTTVTFCYSTSSSLTNCSGATTVAASPSRRRATRTPPRRPRSAAWRPAPSTTSRSRRSQRRHHLRLGAQLHHLPAPPTATTNAATSITATGATLNGSVNAEGASTTVTFCYSTSSRIGELPAGPSPP